MKINESYYLITAVAIVSISILACSKFDRGEFVEVGHNKSIEYLPEMKYLWCPCKCTVENVVYNGQRCEVTGLDESNCTAVDAAKGCICKTRDKVIYDTQSPMMRAPELSIQEFDSVIELLKTEPISRQLVENHYQVFHFFYREGITQHPDTLIKYSVY